MTRSVGDPAATETAELVIWGLSHELRAPVGVIVMAAAGARSATDEAERRALLDALIGEAQRLDRLLANLLDLSRLEAGALRARVVACAPERLAADALRAAGPVVRDADVAIEVDDDCPPALADPFLTERILVNLLHNAMRHGRPPVRLRVESDGERVELLVCDAGPGVDPARARSLFRSFVESSAEGGLGLGLRLCHGLATAQGARLRMLTVPEGACFALSLPAAGGTRTPRATAGQLVGA